MKFKCNCKTDRDLKEMLEELHSAKSGYNFEIGARMWHSPEGFSKTIMVEYQVATQECRDITENADEPDWFTAYEVENEEDCDCSKEIFTETADNFVSVSGLKEAMCEFAKKVERLVVRQRMNFNSSVDEKIQVASSLAAEAHSDNVAPRKEANLER